LLKIKKSPRTVKHTVKKIYTFLQISQESVVLDSAGQGLSFEKKVHKDKCKNKDTVSGYKNIEKHAYLSLQSKF
jgi:hypothetical protein